MILIPCGGHQTRWNGDDYKQLSILPDGEMVLQRLIRQCLTTSQQPYVYGHGNRIAEIAEASGAVGIVNTPYPTLTEFLSSTTGAWKDHVTILLGDTVLSDDTARRILSHTGAPMFFGNHAEIFALSFDTMPKKVSYRQRVITCLEIANCYANVNRRDGGAGKLWSLYKALTHWPQRREVETLFESLFTVITDWSTDIDSVEEYEALYALLEQMGVTS